MTINKFEEKIWLSSPTMHGAEMEFVKEAFDSNWVAPLGKNVNEFEKEIANYIGCADSAAMVSGTSALHCCMKLAGVERGSVVFCSDLTFAASVNPVIYEKGVPVFIDSEKETWNMDPRALEKAFQLYDGHDEEHPIPKAVILVHLYGVPAKIDEIKAICDKYNVPLIEDAAESLGAIYKGKQTGTFGEWAAISFNGNKIITSSGGGMFLSDRVEDVQKVRFWSTQSREPYPHYEHEEIGYNYRMSNIVAGIGRGQLLYLDEHIALKKKIYDKYKVGLQGLPISMNPYIEEICEPNYWLSCLLIEEGCPVTPEDIRMKLDKYNVESRPIWKPMHLQPVYKEAEFVSVEDEKHISSEIFENGLCLPSDIKMTEEQQEIVIQIIRSCFECLG